MADLDADKLTQKLTDIAVRVLEAQNEAAVTSILDLQGEMIERVFLKGEDNSNNQIGQYSTKPLYVSLGSQTSQVRKSSLKPKGKFSSEPEFKNGKKRKSQYFPGGYKEYRETVGRKTDRVNLDLTGALMGSIKPGTTYGNPSLGFTSEDEVKKADGNEKRFGKIIFSPSEQEIEAITDKVFNEVTDAFFSSFE